MTRGNGNTSTWMRGPAWAALAVVLANLAACGYMTRGGPRDTTDADIYDRSTQRVTRIPSEAAACIAEHARASGHTADLVPLYGMESMAVTVKRSVGGELLAVMSLTPANPGSLATMTMWKDAVGDRASFVSKLVQGC